MSTANTKNELDRITRERDMWYHMYMELLPRYYKAIISKEYVWFGVENAPKKDGAYLVTRDGWETPQIIDYAKNMANEDEDLPAKSGWYEYDHASSRFVEVTDVVAWKFLPIKWEDKNEF